MCPAYGHGASPRPELHVQSGVSIPVLVNLRLGVKKLDAQAQGLAAIVSIPVLVNLRLGGENPLLAAADQENVSQFLFW